IEGVVIGVTPFEWDVRVSSKEDPGGHAYVCWPGSLHHSTGHYCLFAECGGSLRVVAAIAEYLGLVAPHCLPLPIQGLSDEQRRRVEEAVAVLDLS
ncbi:hypothetical protein ACR5KS_11370, partial [Leucobacter sp. W1153]